MFNKRNCGCRPMGCGAQVPMNPGMSTPIVEPTTTTCEEKDFYCEVPHICPIHHHTVNRIHYVHTYTPEYSCSESTEIIDDGCGCNGRFPNR